MKRKYHINITDIIVFLQVESKHHFISGHMSNHLTLYITHNSLWLLQSIAIACSNTFLCYRSASAKIPDCSWKTARRTSWISYLMPTSICALYWANMRRTRDSRCSARTNTLKSTLTALWRNPSEPSASLRRERRGCTRSSRRTGRRTFVIGERCCCGCRQKRKVCAKASQRLFFFICSFLCVLVLQVSFEHLSVIEQWNSEGNSRNFV